MTIWHCRKRVLRLVCLEALLVAAHGFSLFSGSININHVDKKTAALNINCCGLILTTSTTTLWMGLEDDNDDDDDLDGDDDENDNPNIDVFQYTSREDPMWRKRSECWVIVVDDEEAIRKAVGQLLFDRGYQVTACADGPTALQVASSKTRRTDDSLSGGGGEGGNNNIVLGKKTLPDCIVSDIRMPEMDGLELLQRIRDDETMMEVPVVLLTAKGMTQDRIAGYNAGADAYLPKPFDPDELVAIVDGVIERHENLNGANVQVDDLKRDLDEIKYLLLEKGGGGIGNGWVEQTNVFLAPDERQILALLCEGLMTKEIAAKTFLSTRRVEQLLTRMFRKTGVKNRTELVRWAVKTGNVQL